jgi:hypothetical protein
MTERERFEAWWNTKYPALPKRSHAHSVLSELAAGTYEAWQAALAQQREPVDAHQSQSNPVDAQKQGNVDDKEPPIKKPIGDQTAKATSSATTAMTAGSLVTNTASFLGEPVDGKPVAWLSENGKHCISTTELLTAPPWTVEAWAKDNKTPLYLAPTIPEGWQLVPIEATLPMLTAICPASASLNEWRVNYRDMLNAAPEYMLATVKEPK